MGCCSQARSQCCAVRPPVEGVVCGRHACWGSLCLNQWGRRPAAAGRCDGWGMGYTCVERWNCVGLQQQPRPPPLPQLPMSCNRYAMLPHARPTPYMQFPDAHHPSIPWLPPSPPCTALLVVQARPDKGDVIEVMPTEQLMPSQHAQLSELSQLAREAWFQEGHPGMCCCGVCAVWCGA